MHRAKYAFPTLAGLLAILSLGMGCTENELEQLDPDVFVSPEAMDFGTVTVGTPTEQLLTVHNVGGGTLHVDSVEMVDGAAGFSVEDFDEGLGADEEVQLVVTFAPYELGPAEDVIRVYSDDPDEPVVEVPVSAVDVLDEPVPAIAWSPSSLSFGQVPSGGTVVLSVTVSSVGTADLALSSVELDPSSSAEFTVEVDPAPVSLPPSHTTQIDVAYTPLNDGLDSGELVLQCNDPDTPEVRIPLAGQLLPSPDIDLVPTQLLFGPVEVGQSVTMDAEIWSLGDADLELGSLIQTGSAEFEMITNPSHEVLPVGESAVVTITYTPVDLTADSGLIEIPSNDPDEPVVTLLLDGSHEAVPDIDVTPVEIDFGLVDVGLTATDAVMVSNVGTGDLSVDAPALTGAVEFGISAAQFPTTIAAGASELILVSYTPADLTADTGQIAIGSDDPDEPLIHVDLLGAAFPEPDIDVVPTLLQFGMVQPGNTATLTSTVSNVGTSDLTLGTLAMGGSTEFSLTADPSGTVLAPGDSTSLEVTYTPDNQGMATGVVDIPSDDPDEPVVHVLLSGSELPIPDIDVMPLQVDFGQVDLGQTGTHSVQVSNLGGADLDVTGVTLVGSAEFSISAIALPGILTPGAQEVVYVSYTPVDEVPDTGTLTFESDDPDEPSVEVELLGEVTPQPDIDVDPWTVDLGDVTLGLTASGSADVLNVGDADLTVYGCAYTGDPQFSLVGCPTGAVIAAGGADLLELQFTPTSPQSASGVVSIASSDPDEPVVDVHVVAQGVAPDIDLDPTQLDFGSVDLGSTLSLDAEIWNLGDGDLYLGSLSLFGSNDFAIEVDPSGLLLTPGDVTTVTVRYGPTDLGGDTGQVQIPSNDPDEPVVTLDLVGEEAPEPDIDVDPLLVDFGQVDVGQTSSQTVSVSNVGTAVLDVSGISLAGPAEFSWSSANLPGTILPGQTRTIYVTYTPVDDLADSGTLTVASDDPDEPAVDVSLFGSPSPEPDIDVDPWTLDFGDVVVDTVASEILTITNVGDADLELFNCSFGGAPVFWITSNPAGTVLGPGDSAELELSFQPLDAVGYTGLVQIDSNDPDEPQVQVDVTGNGIAPDIDLQPSSLNFGQVGIGTTVVMDAEIWNVGAADLTLGTLALSASAEFVLSIDPSGEIVLPGDFTVVEVSYTPVDVLPDTGEVEIPSDDPDEPFVYLQLGGQHEPVPDIEVDPLLVDFGQVDVGQTSFDWVTVSNVGSGSLTVSLPVLSGGNEFSINAGGFPTTLLPGGSQTFMVVYNPVDMTADSGQVTITSDDPDEPTVIVDLLGSPVPEPDIEVDPVALQFGQVQVGFSLALSSTISNVGNADLELGSLSLIGSSDFSITVDPSNQILAPGASTTVEATYAPTNPGSDQAQIQVPSNDPDEPSVAIALTGAEEPVPDIVVDPLVVDFGQVDLGMSPSSAVAVSNVGGASLTVSALSLSGSGDFSVSSPTLPGTVSPGQTKYVTITYTPSDEYADTATLTVVSDDPDEPSIDVAISGEPSDQPDIDVDPWTVDFGEVKVGDVDYEWVTIYNVGNADLTLYTCAVVGSNNFWIATNPTGSTIAPGGSVQMEVAFAPDYGIPYSARVDIASDDPDEPVVEVDLLADGTEPAIQLVPDTFDFGGVSLECEETVDIAVQSVGTAPLELTGYSFFSSPPVNAMTLDPGQLDDYVNNGWDLSPGSEISVTVSFLPEEIASYTGMLSVTSDDPNDPTAQAFQDGDGEPGGYATDTFTQQGDNASDILWVVDNSCSMEDEQGYLGDDFSYFYSIINNAGVDYHISVVTTDDDDFQGATYKVIDDQTPNGAAQFAANCAVGTNGSWTEQGLKYGYDGLVKAENGTWPNSNFWRDDAGLRVVYVSDEPDQSGSWSQYLSWYQSMKVNPDHVILSAICGTNGYAATSCTGPGGTADPGTGYVDVANATGGVLGTICDADWSTVLANLGWIAISLSDTFPLTYEAVPNTVEVYVNGTQLQVGWSYDAVLNAIVFLPAYVPANGDTIVVDYGYYGAC